jgi:hypothetical protein
MLRTGQRSSTRARARGPRGRDADRRQALRTARTSARKPRWRGPAPTVPAESRATTTGAPARGATRPRATAMLRLQSARFPRCTATARPTSDRRRLRARWRGSHHRPDQATNRVRRERFARFAQLFVSVGARRFQEPVADPDIARFGDQQRARRKLRQHMADAQRLPRIGRHDVRGRLRREAGREDRPKRGAASHARAAWQRDLLAPQPGVYATSSVSACCERMAPWPSNSSPFS